MPRKTPLKGAPLTAPPAVPNPALPVADTVPEPAPGSMTVITPFSTTKRTLPLTGDDPNPGTLALPL